MAKAGPRGKNSKTKGQSIKRTILLARRKNASKKRLAEMKKTAAKSATKKGRDREARLRKRSI